jgi:hypothetical protein
MQLEIEAAHQLGEAEGELACRLGVRIAGLIVIVENHDISALELLAMRAAPLRFLAPFARAVGVAGRRYAN